MLWRGGGRLGFMWMMGVLRFDVVDGDWCIIMVNISPGCRVFCFAFIAIVLLGFFVVDV